MNPLLREAAASVQHGWVLGVMTAVFLVLFVAWVAWAWAPGRKAALEDCARMPLDEGGDA
jgi:cbb3-type cytochrome oxidase subunit 3